MTGVAISILTQRADVRPVRRERRRVVRRPLNLRVDISGNDGIARSFAGKNIGMGGVFLSADPSLIQPDDIIKPRFFLNYNGLYRPCCMEVRVMHVSKDGFGVCFHQYDNRLFRYIYKMMYEPIHQVAASPFASIAA